MYSAQHLHYNYGGICVIKITRIFVEIETDGEFRSFRIQIF